MHEFIVLGGAHVDRRGRIFGDTVPGASNPGRWREEAGGGAFNAARNLARLGHRVSLVSPRGGDAEASAVGAAAEQAGVIDRPFVFLDRRTPTYTAILSHDGELVIALADMDLYRMFTPKRLATRAVRDLLAGADLILTDANLPAETLAQLAALARAQSKQLAAIAISPAKVVRFRPILGLIDHLFMNEAEARALSGASPSDYRAWPDILRKLGLSGGAITRGRDAVIAWQAGEQAVLEPPPLEAIGDVTGAGDGFAAGYLHAVASGRTLGEAIVHGVASARIALGSEMAVSDALSHEMLMETLALVPNAEIIL